MVSDRNYVQMINSRSLFVGGTIKVAARFLYFGVLFVGLLASMLFYGGYNRLTVASRCF